MHCLLALFLFGVVLLGLLTVPRLGGYRFLVVLLAWFAIHCEGAGGHGCDLGLVVLVLEGKEFD